MCPDQTCFQLQPSDSAKKCNISSYDFSHMQMHQTLRVSWRFALLSYFVFTWLENVVFDWGEGDSWNLNTKWEKIYNFEEELKKGIMLLINQHQHQHQPTSVHLLPLTWAVVLTVIMVFSTWTITDRSYLNFLDNDNLTPDEDYFLRLRFHHRNLLARMFFGNILERCQKFGQGPPPLL